MGWQSVREPWCYISGKLAALTSLRLSSAHELPSQRSGPRKSVPWTDSFSELSCRLGMGQDPRWRGDRCTIHTLRWEDLELNWDGYANWEQETKEKKVSHTSYESTDWRVALGLGSDTYRSCTRGIDRHPVSPHRQTSVIRLIGLRAPSEKEARPAYRQSSQGEICGGGHVPLGNLLTCCHDCGKK